MRRKKILITGSKGQLAKAFNYLFNKKYKIIALDSSELNIASKIEVESNLIKINPDIVLNCAAFTNVDNCEEMIDRAFLINADAIKNFKKFNGLFFQISTDYVFDGLNGPFHEGSKVNPINNYGKSKLQGERIVKETFENFNILRTNILFGGESKASFLEWIINSINKNDKINVVNDQFNNPLSVFDCARSIDFLINSDYRGLYHIGSDLVCSRYDFAKLIASIWNLNDELILPISTKELYTKLDFFKAKRPLKSGLISNYNFLPKYSLVKSLKEIRDMH
tara:strand:+ start:4507 stop:5346 length:840 start_codon:yes stop_codon:yes gene_type:complete